MVDFLSGDRWLWGWIGDRWLFSFLRGDRCLVYFLEGRSLFMVNE
ncbi:MAG: hypothetical protein ACK5EU_09050 [Pseudanabaena sp.]